MGLWLDRARFRPSRPRQADFFWLSFVDRARPVGERFLGSTVVKATDMVGAVGVAWRLGLNPGGDVQGHAIADDGTLDPDHLAFMLNRLRSPAELACAGVL